MWRLPIAPLVALAALATAVWADSPGSGAEAPEPIATRQTIFSIPFQIQKAQQPAQEPVEIRLYVSTDRGTSWHPYAKVEPSRGQFLFRAVGDGEYWFLVRTLDRSGQVRPQGPNRPELRVLVDTTPPTLELAAARGDAGQTIAHWKVSELAPQPQSLKIQYRTAPGAAWQSVAIPWRRIKVDGPTQTGEVTWVPPVGTGNLEVRAEVSDLAGNRAVTHAQVKADGAAAVTAQRETQAKHGGASDVATLPAQEWRPAKSDTPATTGPAAHLLPTPLARDSATGPADTSSLTETSRTAPPRESVVGRVNPAVRNQYLPHAGHEETSATGGNMLDRRTDGQSVSPVSGTDRQPGPPITGADAQSVPPAGGSRRRMVNSRIFELEYEAGSAGATGLGRVELWGTRDGGRTWDSFGQDPDGRSPMLVTVADGGMYGFRVVVQGDPRALPQPPRGGDAPDVWIGVDLDKPMATILSADRGTGAESNQLIIRWDASDRMLAARPVSLFYSDASRGGWSTIATGLENTGTYAWTPDAGVPERIYLRLEVRDEAGNLGVFETPQAVTLTQSNAAARIRNVRPVGQSAQRGPKRYYFR